METDRSRERRAMAWSAIRPAITVTVLIAFIGAVGSIVGLINNVAYRDTETSEWVSDEISILREVVSDLTAQVAALTERLEAEQQDEIAAQTLTERETRARNFDRQYINGYCSEPREVRWRIDADDGWHIDVTSVSASTALQNNRSVFHGVTELSEDGFTVSGRLVNSGDCVRAFGATLARDERGLLRVVGSYTEISDSE